MVNVPAIAAEDAVCFMWGLPHMSAEALELMAGWDFAVKTNWSGSSPRSAWAIYSATATSFCGLRRGGSATAGPGRTA